VQKCDARRPCTRCTLANTVSECIYGDENEPQLEDFPPSPCTDGPLSVQHCAGADAIEIPATISTYPPAQLGQTPSTSDTTRVVANEPPTIRVFTAGQVPCGPPQGLVLARRNSFGRRTPLDSNPSITVNPSFLSPTMPPELRIPLSFLGEDKLQVQFSDAETTDLDMKMCVSNWSARLQTHLQMLGGCGLCLLGYSS